MGLSNFPSVPGSLKTHYQVFSQFSLSVFFAFQKLQRIFASAAFFDVGSPLNNLVGVVSLKAVICYIITAVQACIRSCCITPYVFSFLSFLLLQQCIFLLFKISSFRRGTFVYPQFSVAANLSLHSLKNLKKNF